MQQMANESRHAHWSHLAEPKPQEGLLQAQKATQAEETKAPAGKPASRRRERAPEAQSIGQGRSTRRKRGTETDTLLSAGLAIIILLLNTTASHAPGEMEGACHCRAYSCNAFGRVSD